LWFSTGQERVPGSASLRAPGTRYGLLATGDDIITLHEIETATGVDHGDADALQKLAKVPGLTGELLRGVDSPGLDGEEWTGRGAES
jgi:hypothetical protein